jgi:hypothetical protein
MAKKKEVKKEKAKHGHNADIGKGKMPMKKGYK